MILVGTHSCDQHYRHGIRNSDIIDLIVVCTYTSMVIQDDLQCMVLLHILPHVDMPARYVGNTPAVRDNTVTFDLLLSSDATAARCALLIGHRVQNETDCKLFYCFIISTYCIIAGDFLWSTFSF